MFFTRPNYIKDASHLVEFAHKVLKYRRDLMKSEDVAEVESQVREVHTLVKARDREPALDAMQRLSDSLERHGWPRKELGWREHVELAVFVLVITAGVQAYILRPFKIPTGSMQPTMNGIIVTPTNKPLPNPLQRLVEKSIFGRTYFEIIPPQDDLLLNVQPIKSGRFKIVDGSLLTTVSGKTYPIPVPTDPLRQGMKLYPGMKMTAGQPFLRGYMTAGDHVIVDEVTYHFRHPKKDDIFVFKTKDIEMIEGRSGGQGQFYVKRLVGEPGDKLRIEPPKLLINGALPELPGIRRVSKAENGYEGYTFPSGSPGEIERNSIFRSQGNAMTWVNGGYEHTVTPGHYFAMGDNSANSWDSRNWGEVPARNAVGRGLFVMWPFGPHWGFVR